MGHSPSSHGVRPLFFARPVKRESSCSRVCVLPSYDGPTNIIVPKPLHDLLGKSLHLGALELGGEEETMII